MVSSMFLRRSGTDFAFLQIVYNMKDNIKILHFLKYLSIVVFFIIIPGFAA